ncbi:MAG: glycosyltransferase family 9 protein [Bacteriovoracaceae bacterium]|nr:glycosyltransferase family 9 protein [Bacteriovoracaceae bacterium]
MKKSILIIQTAFIGDTILASAFARQVSVNYPDHEIHFLLRKGNESVIDGLPFIKKVWIWDKKQNKLRALYRLIKELGYYNFQIVFNIHRYFNSGLITFFTRAKFKVGFIQNPLSLFYTHKVHHQIPYTEDGRVLHEVERNFKLLKKLKPEATLPMPNKPELPITEADFEKVKNLKTTSYVVVAPASVWATKQWPWESYRDLVGRLALSYQVYLIGAPDDKELCEKVRAESNAVNLAGKLSLKQSAALMKDAKRVFVNDSAPVHLASAVNAPTTAFFCATIKEFGYGPLADDSIILESPEQLSCRPCGLHGGNHCPKLHFKCALNISILAAEKTIS